MTFRPALGTTSDLTDYWRTVVRPLGWRQRSLYVLRIDGDDLPSPPLIQVDDLPTAPDSAVGGLAHTLVHLQVDEPGARWALLLCRPGSHPEDATDRAWVHALHDALAQRGVRHDAFHLATDVAIEPVGEQPGQSLAS